MSQAKRNTDSMESASMAKKTKANGYDELALKAVNTIRLLSVDMVAKVNERLCISYYRKKKNWLCYISISSLSSCDVPTDQMRSDIITLFPLPHF